MLRGTTLGAAGTRGSWEVKRRDQATSPQEARPRNHGPVAFATSLATRRKLVLTATEPGWHPLRGWELLRKGACECFLEGLVAACSCRGYPHRSVGPGSKGSASSEKRLHRLCYPLVFGCSSAEPTGRRKSVWKLRVCRENRSGSRPPAAPAAAVVTSTRRSCTRSWVGATGTSPRAAQLSSVPSFPQCGILFSVALQGGSSLSTLPLVLSQPRTPPTLAVRL